MKANEKKYWKKLRKGDLKALGKIYDRYIDDLYHYGFNQTNDKDTVMDGIHDVFLDIYKYRKTIAKTDNIKFYLLRCLKRKLQKNNTTKTISIDQKNISVFSLKNDLVSVSKEKKIISSETVLKKNIKLNKALNKLPSRQKECILMRYTKNIPYEEIAQKMDITVQTARTIVYRGIKSMRKEALLIYIFCTLL